MLFRLTKPSAHGGLRWKEREIHNADNGAPHSVSRIGRWAAIGSLAVGLAACGAATPTTSVLPAQEATSTSAPSTTATAPPVPGRFVGLPSSARPQIDGVIAPDEWDGAFRDSMTDDSPIYAMHDGPTLYLAVDTGEMGAVNVGLATGGEIWILHSSAALGSARYVAGDPDWELAHGFSWCCRSSTDDADRNSLLDREGWQATIGFEGDEGVVEFEIELPWNEAGVAVSSIDGHGVQAFWPTDLSPAAREQLVGQRPSEVDFRLEEWMVVVPAGE